MSDEVETIEEVLTAGRVGPHRESHEPRLMANLFLADGVVPEDGFIAFDATHGIEHWGMDHNGPDSGNPSWAPDGLGCCGIAAPDHGNMAKSGKRSQYRQIGRPKYAGTIGTYCAYGVAMLERAQAPAPENCPDNGVDNATLFAWMYKEGLFDWTDENGVVHEGGYAEVPLDQLDWFAKTFDGAVIGLIIDGDVASQDFGASPRRVWSAMPKQDGHDTYYVKSAGQGPGVLITWGGLQPFDVPFRNENITDAWVFFDKNDAAINRPVLEAALEAVHGTVSSAVAPTTESLLERVEDAFKSIPEEFKAAIKILHKIVDAAMEKESIAVVEKLIADFLKAYAKSL